MSHQLTYQDTIIGIDAAQLSGFFRHWKFPLTPEAHPRLLAQSDFVVLAIGSNGAVVGFVTALSDRVQSAFIPLLEVLPACRGQGIGTELMRRMLEKLGNLPAVDLTCASELQSFYLRLGMMPSVGMIVRNY